MTGGGGDVVVVRLTADFRFSPETVTISPGTTVRWESDASIFHTVTPDGHGEFGRRDFFNAGDSFEHTFGGPGTFDYFCEPHVSFGMRGQIVVQ